MKTLFVLLALTLVACGSASTNGSSSTVGETAEAADSQPLDGRSYAVALTIGTAAPEDDTLVFLRGQFESTACTSKGFPQWAGYTTEQRGEEIAFHVVTRHPDGTTVEWNGTARGEVIEGTANVLMNGQEHPGTFRGEARR